MSERKTTTPDETDPQVVLRWQQIRANKMNQKTANRIAWVGDNSTPEHRQILNDAMKQWAQTVNLYEQFPNTKDLLTAETVYQLAFCSAYHNDRYTRGIAVDVARAIAEGKTVEQCARLFKSKTAYYFNLTKRCDEWEKAQQAREARQEQQQRTYTFNIPKDTLECDKFETATISDDSFEDIGVKAGDVGIVFLTEDIQNGDLILYEATAGEIYVGKYHTAPGGYVRLEALSDEYETEIFRPGEGVVKGRIISFERDGKPLTASVKLRPMRECEIISHTMTHDIPGEDIYEGDTVTILANGQCQNGAVGMAKIKRSFFGGGSDYGKVRVNRIYYPDPEHIRIGESYHGIEKACDVGIVGQVFHVRRAPLPMDTDGILDAEIIGNDDDILDEDIITGISKRPAKPTRRIPVNVKRFEKYGILRGDKATVVMNGDVRVGELGYFAVAYRTEYGRPFTNYFAFVCERDSTCHDGHYNGTRTSESVCLRADDTSKCEGHHNATAYGRVCAIERKRQPVEHTLELRPFDGRM